MVTYKDVRNNPEVLTYIAAADSILEGMGFTEHSVVHCSLCAKRAAWLLDQMDYDDRTIELAKIAALIHDIGNLVNRNDHAHSGALIAFHLLSKMGMNPEEIAKIVSAIGHHDEKTAQTLNPISSALIIADKSDVRYTRVRNYDPETRDIHDRVNYAVKKSSLTLDDDKKHLNLNLIIDTEISTVADYFEIFLDRMLLCRNAASFFGLVFKLNINNTMIL